MRSEQTHQAIERVFREEWGLVQASLVRLCGDLALAEDAIQDAFERALAVWPEQGVPANPAAWIVVTARRKALDRLRRQQTLRSKEVELARALTVLEEEPAMDEASAIPDDRLRLIFTCCHPALALEARVALTLRTLGGLTTAEIARAFLVPESTLAQRIVRAQRKIRDARIPYEVPADHRLPERLGGALAVLYLIFNEGYSPSGGEAPIRPELCREAIRLGRILAGLMPDEPEALGLLALMLLHDARRDARFSPSGDLILLEEQDRSRWDQARIAEGAALVDRALRLRRIGPYQLQAAIAAIHGQATRAEETDWCEVAGLYGLLSKLQPSPVVALNRAVAIAMADGPTVGLALLDRLDAEGALAGYHLLPAARADLLRRQGRLAEAAACYRQALDLVTSAADRAFLEWRLAEVTATA